MQETVSIILPAKNEATSLKKLLPQIRSAYEDAEIIVVNDGSNDDTSEVCHSFDVVEIKHFYSKGNGAAIKSGARRASGDLLVFMDGDGQHKPSDIERLLSKLREGYDMVVGSRDSSSQASIGRLAANGFYNCFAGWVVGQKIEDLTSGFRAVNASKFREYLSLLPNGFSYPTTITMAFFRAGYSVTYIPIKALDRVGRSHINLLRDGVRFLLIIFKIGTLYSPIKIFFPASAFFFGLGVWYYAYTFFQDGRFTNMGALLFSTSVIVFLMGLISEQITSLTFLSRVESEKSEK